MFILVTQLGLYVDIVIEFYRPLKPMANEKI
jgi:hypothetical protein